MEERLRRFLVRDDAEYDRLVKQYQAQTLAGKFFYLFMHLLPGLLAYVLINIPLVHAAALRLTGLSDPMFQGTCLIGVVFVWHAVVPLVVLRWADGLSFRQSLAFLGLRKFDTKGFFLVLPVVFVVFTVLSLPYMKYIFPCLLTWLLQFRA
jgi:CAAX protease family protein